MVGKRRTQQKIYQTEETQVDKLDEYGDKTGEKITTYTIKETYKASVSVFEREPLVVDGGVVADYERTLTLYKKYNQGIPNISEGDRFFIDVEPQIENETITNEPDYVVVKNITTEKGQVYRYKLKKLV